MARRPRASQLETRSARLRLPIRHKPHAFMPVSPGISVGYRRMKGAGSWIARYADGQGGNRVKRIGTADDFEDANGTDILNWFEAIEAARKLAHGSTDAGKPATVNDAIDAYERDLIARGSLPGNATHIRHHMTPALGGRPVGLLTARELAAWRDRLLADGMKPATLVRLCKSFKAALNLAARRDRQRIANRSEWRDGLSGIAEDYNSRNAQRLDDDQVRRVITAAYAVDRNFGLLIETAAVTGARVSQLARLTVGDLQDGSAPRLMMPASRKGRGRKPGKYPVAITQELAHRLATNRPSGEPLLLRSDGRSWATVGRGAHKFLYKKAAERAGVVGTMYALRHSSIVRALLAGIPTRIVAVSHDTSVPMIERTYSAFIADHADALQRRALLATGSIDAGRAKI